MEKRVLITGGGGQLAVELAATFAGAGYEVVALDRRELDISQTAAVESAVAAHRPGLILNAAAYNRVDDAEGESAAAFAVNALGPRALARAARNLEGTVLVHYSTDYVFDGTQRVPYLESDMPLPLSAYGISKLAGEYFVRAEAPRSLVLRVSGVFGPAGRHTAHGNFVERMLALAAAGRTLRVVTDQIVSPTYAPDIATATHALVERAAPPGLYHCAGATSCSFFDYAQGIFAAAGVAADLHPTTSAEYRARARRPASAVLSSARLAALGITPPRPWREALLDYLRLRASREV